MNSDLEVRNNDHPAIVAHETQQADFSDHPLHNEYTSLLSASRMQGQRERYGGISAAYYGDVSPSSSPFHCDDLSSTNEMYIGPEQKLKTRIKYFFMNPLEKWKTKGKFPWKLLLQVVKIIFVTVQLCIFGSDGYAYELQKQHISASFRHIFLKDWMPIREVVSYPPSTGPYAVYTKGEFFENVDHVVKMYANITNLALGIYDYDGPSDTVGKLKFCRSQYYNISASNMTISFDNNIEKICHDIPSLFPPGDPSWDSFSAQEYLKSINDSIKFDRLISVALSFSLRTVFLKKVANLHFPNCYAFHISVDYNNRQHDGQMIISLSSIAERLACERSYVSLNANMNDSYILRQVLNIFIIFICILSLLLCIRCLYKGYRLCKQTDKYFVQEHRKRLAAYEKLEFVDGWYCMMIVNDLLIITGSTLKACIEQRTVEGDQYASCAILLGTGNLLVWAGVLRYLGFFRKYNILILTLKTALPNVMRFMLCCVLLYGGFCFCGWLVLGPYHIKFRDLSTTSECLFAMMNGDDLFATFAITDTNNPLIWWFSRIYLYLFISVFIYVVISLFISVIMDSYETVKDYYRHGSPPTRIQALIADCTEDSCSTFYRQQKNKKSEFWSRIFNCYRRRSQQHSQETL